GRRGDSKIIRRGSHCQASDSRPPAFRGSAAGGWSLQVDVERVRPAPDGRRDAGRFLVREPGREREPPGRVPAAGGGTLRPRGHQDGRGRRGERGREPAAGAHAVVLRGGRGRHGRAMTSPPVALAMLTRSGWAASYPKNRTDPSPSRKFPPLVCGLQLWW